MEIRIVVAVDSRVEVVVDIRAETVVDIRAETVLGILADTVLGIRVGAVVDTRYYYWTHLSPTIDSFLFQHYENFLANSQSLIIDKKNVNHNTQ
jgi:hypothetical protein